MKQICFRAILLGLSLLLSAGCMSYNLTRDGDRYLRAKQPSRALRAYQQAQKLQPTLVNNPRFAANLKTAYAGTHYEEGMQALTKQNWEGAVAAFKKSLDYDPSFLAAHHASLRARDEGAVALRKQALAAADKGNLSEALVHLMRALKLKPEDADVAKAYQYASNPPVTAGNMADRAYLEARSAADSKSWNKAQSQLVQAISLEPNHVAARVMLRSVKMEIARGNDLYTEGSNALVRRNIEKSISVLSKTVEQWPDHPKAAADLRAAKAKLAEADEAYKKGKMLSAQKDWDGAERQFALALKIYPAHAQAKNADAVVRKEAAADYFERGRAALQKGDLDGGWKLFQKSLDHESGKKEAREGMSQVCYVRGRMVEEQELFGNALLWYLEADERYQKDAYLSKIREMEGKIMERIKFGLAFNVSGPKGKLENETKTLVHYVRSILEKEAPDFMELKLNGEGTIVHPSHEVAMVLRSIDSRTERIGQQQKSHSFTQERNIPNPAIPRMNIEVGREIAQMQQMRAMLNQPCPTCRGRGYETCNHCGGAGKYKACGTCNGSGHILHKRTGRRIVCPECGGDGGLKRCIKCKGKGVIPCRTCNGTGIRAGISVSQVRSQESKVARMQRDLAGMPPMVRERTPSRYVYRIEEYIREGRSVINVQLRDLAKEVAPKPKASEAKATYTDKTIDQPRPEIGLQADSLSLPSEEDVRSEALEKGAIKAVRGLMEAAIQQKIEHSNYLEREYRKEKNSKEATESALDAALFLNWIDKNAAKKKIADLRKQMVAEKK